MTKTEKNRSKTINELYQEIDSLKKLLQLKVERYSNLCHPEVVSVSKQLDQVIMKVMKKKNNQNKDGYSS